MAQELSLDEQRRAVYDAICGIAAQCDGAVEKDFVGFDGGDTRWGRSIARVPFEAWTEDDIREGARVLARKYHGQAHRVLGYTVDNLEIVKAEADISDPYWSSREHARELRRREAKSDKIAKRAARLRADGKVEVTWDKGDPDFGALLEHVRALPARRWDREHSVWVAEPGNELAQLIEDFDLAANFEVRLVADEAVRKAAEKVHLTLVGKTVVLESSKAEAFRQATGGYAGSTTKDVFKLYGFRWNQRGFEGVWSLSADRADAELLEIAEACQFRVSDEVKALCSANQGVQEGAQDRESLLLAASTANAAGEVPEAFLELLEGVLA